VSDAPGIEPPKRDVVDRALGSLDHLLDVLHDNVLRPIILGGRFVAYGFILLAVVITMVVALLVSLTRLLNVYVFPGKEWATYFFLGAVLVALGFVFWRSRRPVRLRKP
jgi:hypothetical protein